MFFDPYLFSVSAFLFKLLLCNNKQASKDMTNDGKSANGCRFRGCKKTGGGRRDCKPRTKEPPRGQTKGIMGGQFVYLGDPST